MTSDQRYILAGKLTIYDGHSDSGAVAGVSALGRTYTRPQGYGIATIYIYYKGKLYLLYLACSISRWSISKLCTLNLIADG
jgi:hypothetical protein